MSTISVSVRVSIGRIRRKISAAEWHCLKALGSYMEMEKGVLGTCYSENSKRSMENVFSGV